MCEAHMLLSGEAEAQQEWVRQSGEHVLECRVVADQQESTLLLQQAPCPDNACGAPSAA